MKRKSNKNGTIQKRIHCESNIWIKQFQKGLITLSELISKLKEVESEINLELMKQAIEIKEQRESEQRENENRKVGVK